MTLGGPPSFEYVAARRVLLDAVYALRPHEEALILAGARAVYLHTGPDSLPVADFTTDGDLTLDPALLAKAPPLGDLMRAGGFDPVKRQGVTEPGIWQKVVEVGGREIQVPVDLIVPSEAAPPGGKRGARLEGHGKWAARKSSGLEAALFDNTVMTIEPLEPGDSRRGRLRIAGIAALLIAKTHHRAGPGVELASRALREAMPEDRVRAISLAFTEGLNTALRGEIG